MNGVEKGEEPVETAFKRLGCGEKWGRKGQWLKGHVEPGESLLKVVVWVLVGVAHRRKRLKQQQREGTVRLSVRRQGGGIDPELSPLLCSGNWALPWRHHLAGSRPGWSLSDPEGTRAQ